MAEKGCWREYECIATIRVRINGPLDEKSEKKRAKLLLAKPIIELNSAVPTELVGWRIGVIHAIGRHRRHPSYSPRLGERNGHERVVR